MIGRPFSVAGPPSCARNSSSRIGSYTAPASGLAARGSNAADAPSGTCTAATDTAKCGMPCAKLVVPSSGSTNHRKREPVRSSTLSSVTTSWSGKWDRSTSRTAPSQARSTSVTRSISPLWWTANSLP